MKLEHIDLHDLKCAALNVRRHGGDNVDDLIASIRALGVIQPLLVRPNCQGFEVVAGQRRLKACQALAAEGGTDLGPIPCAVMDEGDDAKAIEASLAENAARLPMDELDQYEAFAALVAQGKTSEEIANSFGVGERLVKQRLAIAGLHKPILNAYRKEEIDAQTMRHLTLATPRQQRQWYKLFKSEDAYAPTGRALKAWLFGGAEIPVTSALFPLDEYPGAIKGDLFGEEQYFTDPDAFWTLQNKAIAAKAEAYRKEGWNDVIVLSVGEHFSRYDKVQRTKEDGGKVYIACAANGEVAFHEGWLDDKDAKRLDREKAKAEGTYVAPVRDELTRAAQRYLDLHRHAAVRTELHKHPAVAIRLIAAHAIGGSGLWNVQPEPQNARGSEGATQSLEGSRAEKEFAKERKAVLKLLGIEERSHIVKEHGGDVAALFERMVGLSDKQVMRVLAFVMAETLESGTAMIDTLGAALAVDMGAWWSPDDAFFALLRDKPAINAMLADVAGKATADAHVTSTAAIQKGIVRNHLSGKGREKVEGWLPPYMRFPMQGYTERYSADRA